MTDQRHVPVVGGDGKPMQPFDHHDKGIMAMIAHNASALSCGRDELGKRRVLDASDQARLHWEGETDA